MAFSSQVVRVDGLRSLPAASISGTYQPVGSSFGFGMRLIKMINTCNADITVSFDGVNDNDYIPSGGFALYDLTTNKISSEPTFVFQPGTQVFAKGSPATGTFYVVCLYGKNG